MNIHIEVMKELSEASSTITYMKGALTTMNQLMADDNPAKAVVTDLVNRLDDYVRQSNERAKLFLPEDP